MQDIPLSEFPSPADAATVLTVSSLNRLVRTTLEANIPLLKVAGEISNLTRAASGHVYFTLKDENAQVRCVMWRNRAQSLSFRPEHGMRVEARVLVTLYEVRGDFQLSVESLSRAGTGNLYEAFLRLKDRLGAEGLFDPLRKRPLPRFPRRIGVVTSTGAAALHDVLTTLRRRAPHLEIIVYPSLVQGQSAGAMLTEMVTLANRRAGEDGIEALLLVRGGGSLEDLWAFNDESLARAIYASEIPVISGVGHETDFTIADFAADMRAATPTAAAELASAGYHEAAGYLAHLSQALARNVSLRLHTLAQRLDRAALRLVHPQERLGQASERAANLERRLRQAMTQQLRTQDSRIQACRLRLAGVRPDLERAGERHDRLAIQLQRAIQQLLREHADRVTTLTASLSHLAPQAVLARGYSITRNAKGDILRSAADVHDGEKLLIQLHSGQVHATADPRKPS